MNNCEFHQRTIAKWHCSECNSSYCEACVLTEKSIETVSCPVCLHTLELNAPTSKNPLWKQLANSVKPRMKRKKRHATPLPNVLYKAHVFRKAGDIPKAIQLLSNHLSEETLVNDANIQTRELFHELLKLESKNTEMLEHAKTYISTLITHASPKKAFPIYRDCLKTERSFKLNDAEETFRLCKAAHNAMDYRLFLAASDGFIKQHPDFHGNVELYIMVATTLSQEFRKDKEAQGILRYLLKKYPFHELTPEIEKQLKLVKKIETSNFQ